MISDMSSDLTTVKVTKRVRERIARASRSQHVPANEFLDRLITDWERRYRMAAAANAMQSASAHDMETYNAEAEAWDATLADGLDD